MIHNLVLRGKRYSIRLFIPVDLREPGGRIEIVRSTKTSDKKQARLLLRRVQEVAERLFFMVRIGLMDKGKLVTILQGYIENALVTWGKDRERLRDVDFDLSETSAAMYVTEGQSWAEQYRNTAAGVRRDYFERGKKGYIKTHAKILLKDNAIDIAENSDEFAAFCDQFVKVHVKALDELANREEGNFSYDYKEYVAGMLQEDRPVTLKQAVDEWLELKQSKGLKDGSMEMYRINSNLAVTFYGEDYLVKLLNNRELLRFVQHEQGRDVKNTTITRRVRLIKDVVNLACADHGLPHHTYKIELKDDSADIQPLSADDLNKMFVLLGDTRKIKDWQYWAVLIALLAGLRREEVVSLRVKDIKQDNDIWYFDITDSKTEAGIRYTPISDILMQLDFLDFYKEREKSKEPYLLMCYLPAPKSIYSPVPAEKFGDFFKNLKKKFIPDDDLKIKRLHSLRHNYSDALKQGGVRPDIIDELCGHEHAPGSMRSIYDEKFGLEVLAENLKRTVWKCDFSLLRTWTG